MNLISVVVFDMYNTLVHNSADQWKVTFQEIIQEQGLNTTGERLWEAWSGFDKEYRAERAKPGTPFRTYYETWKSAFSHAFESLELKGDPEAAVRKSILAISQRAPYPETGKALDIIQQGWRTAVLSNADDDFLLPNLAALGAEFEVVLSSEQARNYKPMPGVFLEMLNRLGTQPHEAVYVGDRQYEDVQGATDAGMKTVWINRSGDSTDPNLPTPAYQISSLLELPQLLQGWPQAKDGRI